MVKSISPYEGPWAASKPTLFAFPTGDWRSQRPVFNSAKCRHCGICYFQCPVGSIKDMDTYCAVDLTYCKGCGVCAEECPRRAVLMEEESKWQ